MKRILIILLTALICIGVSLTAFADGLESAIRSVECMVTNPQGAVFYEITGSGTVITTKIPYNTQITIGAVIDASGISEKFDGKRIGSVNYNDIYGYVELSDIAPVDGEFSLNEAQKIEYPPTYIVSNSDGLTMYAGPSQVFEDVGRIPDGAEITLKYRDVGNEDHQANSFFYTEFNGQRGWVYKWSELDYMRKVDNISNYSGQIKVVGNDVGFVDIFAEKVNYGNYYGFKKVGETIPADTVLSFELYYDDIQCALVEYNGTSGYIDLDPYSENDPEVIAYINDDVMTLADCKVFSRFNDLDSETGETIPAYTLLPAKAYSRYNRGGTDGTDYEWFLVDYNGHEVWIQCSQSPVPNGSISDIRLLNRYNENTHYYYYGFKGYYKTKGTDAYLMDTPANSSNSVYKVTQDDILRGFLWDNGMRFVEVIGGNQAGWINTEDIEEYVPASLEKAEASDDSASLESSETATGATVAATDAIDIADAPLQSVSESIHFSGTIIIICVAAAVVIALTAIVVIILIKRKKTAEAG